MFNNSYKLLFMFTLISGTLVTCSSNTWMSAWMGLEINLLSFIPLMNDSNNLMSSESSLKYFLIQALASSIILFMTMIYLLYYINFDMLLINKFLNMGMMSSLMMKMGMTPFHFWFPNVIEGLSWMNCFMLISWQKIAPMMLMSYLYLNYMTIPIIMSLIIGAIGGLNQTSLRKIMAYSSINHLGWMMLAMNLNEILWLNYFLFYSYLSMILIFYFNFNKMYFINQMYMIFNYKNELKLILFMNFLSFGGLPPFLGFLPKWYIIEMLSNNNQLFMILLTIMLTLITLFYYIRMCFASFLMNYYENKWNINFSIKFNNWIIYLTLSVFSILGLLMIDLLYFIL